MACEKWFCLFLLLILLPGNHLWRIWWNSGPDPATVLHACAGSTLSLPWDVFTNHGNIQTIRWFYSGRSYELIASFDSGHFQPTPAFSGRVRQSAHYSPNCGIEIDHVTTLENGTYSVTVLVNLIDGGAEELSGSVAVSVDDGLATVDGHLHVVQNAVAEHGNRTGQYHLALACGTSTTPARPTLNVKWETGQQVASLGYQDGKFYLLLPNPVDHGYYVCSLPSALACTHSATVTGRAVRTVDTLEARVPNLAVQQGHLETGVNAKVNDLQRENVDLKAQVSRLQTDVSNLENRNTVLQQKLDALEHRYAKESEHKLTL